MISVIMIESLFCLIIFVITMAPQARGCQTLFVFGDSNSDTGSLAPAGLGEVGRFCDGRVINDFFAEKLKLPHLVPYMDSIGANFSYGANFAVTAQHVLTFNCLAGDSTPFPLDKQISQFIHFKARTTALYNALSSKEPKEVSVIKKTLPRPEDFPKALYIVDIGQNDVFHLLPAPEETVQRAIPDIVGNMSEQIQRLAKEGARFFRVHNTGPIGCLPYNLGLVKPKPDDLDQHGCALSANKIAQRFNTELRGKVSELRKQLPNTRIMYVDMYAAKYELIATAEKEGFVNPTIACCTPNESPSRYVSWDGTHYTEAANHWVADRILDGSLSDPPLSIEKNCLDM